MRIDRETLRKLWPRAPLPLVNAVADHSAAVFRKYGITTRLRAVHFLAQVSHESGGGTIKRESLNYSSAERIAKVWPRRFTVESARPYVHNERKLADKVYNGRMGNRPGSDDGYDFRGNSLLQLTGRTSHREIGAIVGLPLEDRPELACSPDYALEVAAAEFKKLGCLPFCDKDNVEGVTRRVNGGYIGLESRKAWLAKWRKAYPAEDEADEEAEAAPEREDEPAPVEIPRGSDDRLPAGVERPGKTMAGFSSTWAAVLGFFTVAGTQIGQALDAVKPLLQDERTIIAVIGVAAAAGIVVLYENHARVRNDHA